MVFEFNFNSLLTVVNASRATPRDSDIAADLDSSLACQGSLSQLATGVLTPTPHPFVSPPPHGLMFDRRSKSGGSRMTVQVLFVRRRCLGRSGAVVLRRSESVFHVLFDCNVIVSGLGFDLS